MKKLGLKLAVIMFVIGLSVPASATSAQATPSVHLVAAAKNEAVNSGTVGSRTSLSVTAYNREYVNAPRYAVNVIGYFSSHTKNSVKLTKLKICYSGAKNSSLWLYPNVVPPSGKNVWSGKHKTIYTGKCQEWTGINKTYSKSAKNELFQVQAYANGSKATFHGFKR